MTQSSTLAATKYPNPGLSDRLGIVQGPYTR